MNIEKPHKDVLYRQLYSYITYIVTMQFVKYILTFIIISFMVVTGDFVYSIYLYIYFFMLKSF